MTQDEIGHPCRKKTARRCRCTAAPVLMAFPGTAAARIPAAACKPAQHDNILPAGRTWSQHTVYTPAEHCPNPAAHTQLTGVLVRSADMRTAAAVSAPVLSAPHQNNKIVHPPLPCNTLPASLGTCIVFKVFEEADKLPELPVTHGQLLRQAAVIVHKLHGRHLLLPGAVAEHHHEDVVV